MAVAKGTPEDESLQTAHAKFVSEMAEVVGDPVPDPRAEITVGVEKVRQATLELDRSRADAMARVAAKFQQSCEAVSMSLRSDEVRAQLLELSREAQPIMSAVAQRAASSASHASDTPVSPEVASARAALDNFLSRVLILVERFPPP